MNVDISGAWRPMDPASGELAAIGAASADGFPLSLAPREAVLMVSQP